MQIELLCFLEKFLLTTSLCVAAIYKTTTSAQITLIQFTRRSGTRYVPFRILFALITNCSILYVDHIMRSSYVCTSNLIGIIAYNWLKPTIYKKKIFFLNYKSRKIV